MDKQAVLINNSLKSSYVESNKLIKTKSESYFKLKLKSIQLNSNQIESIEKNAFNKLKYLTTLILANNKLNIIYDYYFEKLFNLYKLDLSNN